MALLRCWLLISAVGGSHLSTQADLRDALLQRLDAARSKLRAARRRAFGARAEFMRFGMDCLGFTLRSLAFFMFFPECVAKGSRL